MKYFNYSITPHQWTELHETRGQFNILVNEKTTYHTGYRVKKGNKTIGWAKTVCECKKIVQEDRKYTSKKCIARIKSLKCLEIKLYKKAKKLEKSPNLKIKQKALVLFDKSRAAGHKAFNLEMKRPESQKY